MSSTEFSQILKDQREYFSTTETRPLKFRIQQLEKLKKVVLENESLITDALYKDLRKSQFESYVTEIGVLIEEINFTIKNLKKWNKTKTVGTPLALMPSRSKIYQEPYGIVGVFAPWNYPFYLLLAPAVGAIAAGNCVILKPADLSSNIQKVIIDLINNNFEAEFMHAIGGGVPECEELLKEKFDYIFFTGSPRVGKIIMKAAAEHLTPVCLELGGKSPCIVDKKANIKVSARRIVWSKFLNAGQTCVAPDYLYVHKDIKDEFMQEMKNRIAEAFESSPKDSDYLGRIISDQHHTRLIKYLDTNKIYCGGEHDASSRYIAPTMLTDITWDSDIMQEEIFGPIMPVMSYNSLDTVISEVNSRPKPLALYFYTEDCQNREKVINETSSGGVCINDCVVHLGNPYLPFGGVGNSGMGAYHGEFSYRAMSHAKGVLINTTKFDPPLRYRPFTDKKLSWIKKLL